MSCESEFDEITQKHTHIRSRNYYKYLIHALSSTPLPPDTPFPDIKPIDLSPTDEDVTDNFSVTSHEDHVVASYPSGAAELTQVARRATSAAARSYELRDARSPPRLGIQAHRSPPERPQCYNRNTLPQPWTDFRN